MFVTKAIINIINYIKHKKDIKRLILSIILGIISCYIFLKLFNYFFKGPLILLVGSIFGLYIYIYGNNHRITTL
uniref:Uncharacterized protein n=1 Tax=viral metagenome TaxID=1070528 RepID=A0A6C0J7M0_9ZZZZ